MPDGPAAPEWLTLLERGLDEVPGVLTGSARAGLKSQGDDVAVIYCEHPCVAAGVFTANTLRAAPAELTASRIQRGQSQAVVANSGNANCCTGEQGMRDAKAMGAEAASLLGLPEAAVAVASTGIIGVHLPMNDVLHAIEAACKSLGKNGNAAARAILTTDTRPKEVAVRFDVGGTDVTIAGITKGAAMIAPHMATMLCFLFTDAAIAPEAASAVLKSAVDNSFNAITVDGDTSTNDMALLHASGISGADCTQGEGLERFSSALRYCCTRLALDIVADGEGATKIIEITVEGAASAQHARAAGMTIANSVLVKTAMSSGDPNWGRVAAALGRSDAKFEPQAVRIWLNDVLVMADGGPQPFDPVSLSQSLKASPVRIRVALGAGEATSTVWTCDLTEEYVRFNTEYTT